MEITLIVSVIMNIYRQGFLIKYVQELGKISQGLVASLLSWWAGVGSDRSSAPTVSWVQENCKHETRIKFLSHVCSFSRTQDTVIAERETLGL